MRARKRANKTCSESVLCDNGVVVDADIAKRCAIKPPEKGRLSQAPVRDHGASLPR